MKLPRDFARCDGLLPKQTVMPNGKPALAYVIDCREREHCARFRQIERDDPQGRYIYTAHNQQPGEKCPSYIKEDNT